MMTVACYEQRYRLAVGSSEDDVRLWLAAGRIDALQEATMIKAGSNGTV